MSIMAKVVSWIKKRNFIANNPQLRGFIKKAGICGSKIIYPSGVPKNIGNVGTFLLSHEFVFSDFQTWGERHNNGFIKLLEIAKGKNIVFDMGAHIGLCALPLSKVINKEGVCYAFEPSTINLKYLQMHIEINDIKNVVIVPKLVGGEKTDDAIFYETDKVSGMNAICDIIKKTDDVYICKKKQQTTIDDFVRENNCIPEVIKIDVEGAEMDVLRGGENTLKRFRPEIILSVHPNHLQVLGYSLDELKDYIFELGYRIYTVDGDAVDSNLELKEYYLY